MRMTRTVLVAVFAVLLTVAGTALAAVYKDISEFRYVRKTNTAATAGADYTADANLNKVTLQAQQFFRVNTVGGAVDLDFADDAALDSADIGALWTFCVDYGGTNALTVTAGASGVTTVKLIESDGTTCEDVGDCIDVIAYSTTAASVITHCAD